MIAYSPSQMRHHHVRCLHRLQSRTDAQRKTVRLGNSRGTRRHCKCNQHGKSALPTISNRESYRGTTFRTFCVDAVTEFCETCTSQSRSRPDDVSFHVQAWTRRTTKQLFQQLTLACRVAMIGTMRATFDNRQSNTILNKVVKRVRFFFRN